MRDILMTTAFIMSLTSVQPAMAALGNPVVYAQDEVAMADIDYSALTGGVSKDASDQICVPPEAQYIPSFIRDPAGEIVGINYTIVEYVC